MADRAVLFIDGNNWYHEPAVILDCRGEMRSEQRRVTRRNDPERYRTIAKSAAHSWGPQWTSSRPSFAPVGISVAPSGRNECSPRE